MMLKNGNGFVQRLIIVVISIVAPLFLGWLSWAVIDIQIVSGRMDERMIEMDRKLTGLVNATTVRTEGRVERNTDRLNDIQGNAQ